MGLRTKLLLAASALVLVPLAAYQYLLSAQAFMGDAQQRATLTSARALARMLEASPTRVEATRADGLSDIAYLLPLESPPQVDGESAEWAELVPPLPLERSALVVGVNEDRIYALIALSADDLERDSRLRFQMSDGPGFASVWQLSLASSGALEVHEVVPGRDAAEDRYIDRRFRAALGRAGEDRLLELSFPAPLLGRFLGVSVDHPPASQRPPLRLPDAGYYTLARPSPALEDRLAGLAGTEGRRIWVLDRRALVLARDGVLPTGDPDDLASWLLARLLPEPDPSRLSLTPSTGRLDAPEVGSALAGRERTLWRRAETGGPLVISAAVPIRIGDAIDGAVVVEDSVIALEGLHARGLVELTIVSLAAFSLAIVSLLWVSARLVSRLRTLRDAVHAAFDAEGRVGKPLEAPTAADEIGDLGRSFAAALERIRGYNQYLEELGRRLSHEFRTPITVVRSSLENLALSASVDDSQRTYLERAQLGVQRLDGMLRRMADATRLEHAVRDDERETMDLVPLIDAAVSATADAWPGVALEFERPSQPVLVSISPALVIQALDKLLANAREFHREHTPIFVRIGVESAMAQIVVENQGPCLEPELSARMFDSMVSERAGVDDGQVHLGLGLHIVRLVAEGHGGRVLAANLEDASGVRIGFTLPTLGASA